MDSVQWLGVAVLASTAVLWIVRRIALTRERHRRLMREVKRHDTR